MVDKLAKHFNAYQYGTLSTERLNQWKKDIASTQKIDDKIRGLKGRTNANIVNFQKHFDLKTIEAHIEFSEVLRGSMTILGM